MTDNQEKAYAERKAEKYNNAAFRNRQKSNEKWKQGEDLNRDILPEVN